MALDEATMAAWQGAYEDAFVEGGSSLRGQSAAMRRLYSSRGSGSALSSATSSSITASSSSSSSSSSSRGFGSSHHHHHRSASRMSRVATKTRSRYGTSHSSSVITSSSGHRTGTRTSTAVTSNTGSAAASGGDSVATMTTDGGGGGSGRLLGGGRGLLGLLEGRASGLMRALLEGRARADAVPAGRTSVDTSTVPSTRYGNGQGATASRGGAVGSAFSEASSRQQRQVRYHHTVRTQSFQNPIFPQCESLP